MLDRARILGPWPLILAGWACVLGMVAVALLAACVGPRTEAVEDKAAQVVEQLEAKREALAAVDGGSADAAELRAEIETLRAQLAELVLERGRALRDDTRDAGTDLVWSLADVLLLGGAGAAAYRHRSKTRQRDMAELRARLDELETSS